MKAFKNKDEAIKFAKKHIGKYEAYITLIEDEMGKPHKAFLTATSLPIEEKIRNPIEDIIVKFLQYMDYGNENDIYDIACSIGAEVSGILQKRIEEESKIEILSAFDEY